MQLIEAFAEVKNKEKPNFLNEQEAASMEAGTGWAHYAHRLGKIYKQLLSSQ